MEFKLVRAGLTTALFFTTSPCLWTTTSIQEMDRTASNAQSEIQTAPTPLFDFEVKIAQGEFFVRQKGTREWKRSSKLNEPIAVGSVDGDQHKIYVGTKGLKPPKALRTEGPEFPPSERKSGKHGQVLLHIIVDDHGAVRFPTVDASPGPEFTSSALKSVNRWKFEPAKLKGRPVAALVAITMVF